MCVSIKFFSNSTDSSMKGLNATRTSLYRDSSMGLGAFCAVFLWSELDSVLSTRLVRAFPSTVEKEKEKGGSIYPGGLAQSRPKCPAALQIRGARFVRPTGTRMM